MKGESMITALFAFMAGIFLWLAKRSAAIDEAAISRVKETNKSILSE